MVKTETNTTHPAAFIDQPVATPHQSRQNIGSEMPIFHRDSFPPGEAKDSKNFGVHHSTKHSIAGTAGRQVGDPYRVRGKPLACSNQRGTLPQLRVRSAAPSEREPRVLRTGERRAVQYHRHTPFIGGHSLSQPVRADSSPFRGAEAAAPQAGGCEPPLRVRGKARCMKWTERSV